MIVTETECFFSIFNTIFRHLIHFLAFMDRLDPPFFFLILLIFFFFFVKFLIYGLKEPLKPIYEKFKKFFNKYVRHIESAIFFLFFSANS